MPFYRIGGSMVHIRMDKRQRKNAPPACPFWVYESRPEGQRVKVRCLAMAPYLCDWLGCDVPICEQHRLALGPELDVCPDHNARRGLFSRLLPAPQ